jgi:hypothetical protein
LQEYKEVIKMASKKLKIVMDDSNFNVRYENMARAKKPVVIAKAPNGKEVSNRTVFQGKPLLPGSTTKKWLDDTGKEYSKQELTFYVDGEATEECGQTKEFAIDSFEPLADYTDKYVIGKYYELWADDDGFEKDIDRNRAIARNNVGLRKLWEKLTKDKVVARGEFNTGRGFVVSDGYIRAYQDGNKWGVEIGMFDQRKEFHHLQEGIPEMPAAKPETKKKRVKRI